jgi:hypothetical protein
MKQPNFTTTFTENLSQLPTVDSLTSIELFNATGESIATIENKPGQAGSLRIYAWLAREFGAITSQAATVALQIYAEHTADAQANPGKHPNIDRLFGIQTSAQTLQVKQRQAL